MGVATPEKIDRNEEIYQLHLKGVSYNKLAKQFDLTVQRIHAILKRKKEQN